MCSNQESDALSSHAAGLRPTDHAVQGGQGRGEGRTYQCKRCGAECPAMRLPDEWSDQTVAKWLAVEARFICDQCEKAVTAWTFAAFGDDL